MSMVFLRRFLRIALSPARLRARRSRREHSRAGGSDRASRGVGAAAIGFALLALVPPTANAPALTPPGPATLQVGYAPVMACPTGSFSLVLVKWRVEVGPASTAGVVRPVFGGTVGDPVLLPAEAG